MYFVMNDDNVQFITNICVAIQYDNVHYEYIKMYGVIMMKCALSSIMTSYINYNKMYTVI